MVYQIIFKKRFRKKLEKLLTYLENEFGLLIAQQFAKQLDSKLITLQKQPFMGRQSVSFSNIKSFHAGNYNRVYYRIEEDRIVILNMYDTRINPKRNKLR